MGRRVSRTDESDQVRDPACRSSSGHLNTGCRGRDRTVLAVWSIVSWCSASNNRYCPPKARFRMIRARRFAWRVRQAVGAAGLSRPHPPAGLIHDRRRCRPRPRHQRRRHPRRPSPAPDRLQARHTRRARTLIPNTPAPARTPAALPAYQPVG